MMPKQAEGEALARKNGELEAMVRKLRTNVRQLETERDRTAGRLAALEASLASEQERAIQATQAAAVQVIAEASAGCSLSYWRAHYFC